METVISGPGTLAFWWKVSSAPGDKLELLVDGLERTAIEGEVDWRQVITTLGTGSHTVRWRYARDASGWGGLDLAAIDEVSFTPGPPVALADAHDNADLGWTSSGNGLWTGQSGVSHDGTDAGQSPALGDGEESWVGTTVSGAGSLSFWWNVSSQADQDLLVLEIDGLEQSFISGETGWQQVNHDILTDGVHEIRWTYRKDGSGSSGTDAAWLDEVSFVASPISRYWRMEKT